MRVHACVCMHACACMRANTLLCKSPHPHTPGTLLISAGAARTSTQTMRQQQAQAPQRAPRQQILQLGALVEPSGQGWLRRRRRAAQRKRPAGLLRRARWEPTPSFGSGRQARGAWFAMFLQLGTRAYAHGHAVLGPQCCKELFDRCFFSYYLNCFTSKNSNALCDCTPRPRQRSSWAVQSGVLTCQLPQQAWSHISSGE
jgi:hypothetical protein